MVSQIHVNKCVFVNECCITTVVIPLCIDNFMFISNFPIYYIFFKRKQKQKIYSCKRMKYNIIDITPNY
jgi:hypothetical protein